MFHSSAIVVGAIIGALAFLFWQARTKKPKVYKRTEIVSLSISQINCGEVFQFGPGRYSKISEFGTTSLVVKEGGHGPIVGQPALVFSNGLIVGRIISES